MMSLLEGHADVVMDGVGPGVIPSVEQIREKFQERRGGGTWLDQLLKRLLGLDAKMKQYRDGAIFVRGAIDRVGMEGFNRVWTSAETLPTKAEITDPDAWVRRVHGDAAVA
jgi:putative hydrolase